MRDLFRNSVVVAIVVIAGGVLVMGGGVWGAKKAFAATTASVVSPFIYNFDSDGTLFEVGSIGVSTSPYWWLNSGAELIFMDGVGKTVQGSLLALDPWRVLYAITNPIDTDNGYHPQNIFRLVTRSSWKNFQQTAYFRITRDQLSASSNRNASNGLLLLNRYQNSDNLYYVGVRVDGAAVVKKKINGVYYTIAYRKIFPGTYHRMNNPNLLPKQQWIGLRSELITNIDGTVDIRLYTDVGRTGTWNLALQARDNGRSFGGASIGNAGYAGIRTDFMDIEFEDYKILAL